MFCMCPEAVRYVMVMVLLFARLGLTLFLCVIGDVEN